MKLPSLPRSFHPAAPHRHPAIHRAWLVLRSLLREVVGLQFLESAASLAFLSLVAIVPIVSVGLLVLASVPAFAEMRDQLQVFLAENLLLPQVANTVIEYVNQFADAAGRLSLVGTVLFFVTALWTMLEVEDTFNRIWRSARRRPLVYRIALYWAALTAGPLVLAGLVWLNLRLDSATGGFLSGVPHWIPWLFSTALLALGYRLIPYRPVRMLHALIGAGFAALLLEFLKWGIARYVYAFPTYEVVYGAFSVLPVFLLWVYSVWVVVLLGALLAANLGFADTDAIVIHGPAAEFERARDILERIARRGPGDGVAVRELGGVFGHNAAVADRVGSALARLGYIIRVWPVTRRTSLNYVWTERWIGSPQLPQMSLRALRDEIWLRGRLHAAGPAGSVVAPDPPDAELLDEPIGRSDE